MTPFQQHVAKWRQCTACKLHKDRKNVVLCRGTVPCDILFVGEAPGSSEDVLGEPFVGPAGHLMNQIIDQSMIGGHWTYALTNLVACIPLGEDGNKVTEPETECIKACRPRLVEFVRICKPRATVMVGRLAGKQNLSHNEVGAGDWLGKNILEFQEIIHPAAIIRGNISQRNLSIRQCVVRLDDLCHRLNNPPPF